MDKRVLCFLTVGLLLLGVSDIASAKEDRVARLIQILQTDSSYKVRLQVCVTLGKLKDKRAVPALIKALADENFTVRGVAAAALGQIGDKRGLPDLQRLAQTDANAFVRSQAERAAKLLGAAGQAVAVPAGVRFFLTVGKVSNKGGQGGEAMAKILGNALVKEFARVQGVTTDWGGRLPAAAELTKRGVKGFVLDGSIISLTMKRSGENYEVSCSIKVSLATFPGNSMKAFYTGGASTEVPARSFKPEYEEGLYRDVLEGAAQGAQQHIVQSYLSSQ